MMKWNGFVIGLILNHLWTERFGHSLQYQTHSLPQFFNLTLFPTVLTLHGSISVLALIFHSFCQHLASQIAPEFNKDLFEAINEMK